MIYNEYDVLKNLNHPHIGILYEIFQETDYAAFVMEFIGGGEIYAKIRQVRKLSEEASAQII